MLRYYHYRKLSPRSRSAYKKIAEAIRNFEPSVVAENVTNFQEVVNAVKDDNPHFFYVDWRVFYHSASFRGDEMTLHFRYHMNKREATALYNKLKAIASHLRGRDDYETVKNVHDYIARTTRYDTPVVEAGGHRINDHNLIGPLNERLGVCEGISRATQFLLRELQVECTYSCGYINESGVRGLHAWNVVCLGGKRLMMDVTWDLASENFGSVSYKYFCVPM